MSGIVVTMVVHRAAHRTVADGLVVHARLHNGGTADVRLRDLDVVHQGSANLSLAGDLAEWLPMYHKYTPAVSCAEQLPSRAERVRTMWQDMAKCDPPFEIPQDCFWQDGRWRSFRDWMTLFRSSDRRGLVVVAVDTCCDADIDLFVDPDGGHSLRLASVCSDCVVAAGATRLGGDLLLLTGEFDAVTARAFQAMADGCSRVRISRRWSAGVRGMIVTQSRSGSCIGSGQNVGAASRTDSHGCAAN